MLAHLGYLHASADQEIEEADQEIKENVYKGGDRTNDRLLRIAN